MLWRGLAGPATLALTLWMAACRGPSAQPPPSDAPGAPSATPVTAVPARPTPLAPPPVEGEAAVDAAAPGANGATGANDANVTAPPPPPRTVVGPKGDGTCVRIETEHRGAGGSPPPSSPAPCPDAAKLASLPDDVLSPVACDWAEACDVRGYEGCCVGCKNPFRAKISRACALETLRLNTCATVKKKLLSPGCLK